MIQTGFESRVKIQQIIDNQLPEFILEESPKLPEFLKQYYISQEYQGGPVDIAENLDQYLKLDNLISEVIVGVTSLSSGITTTSETIEVASTKGFPNEYGLFKINDEIVTYTGITTNSFTGCVRGFSGISSYHQDLNQGELIFSTSSAALHPQGTNVENLSTLFLKDFYKKLKYSLTPGLEDVDFVSDLNVGNFIKEARSFYESKGTDEAFRILFNVLYGVQPRVVNLEDYLIKPSSARYTREELTIAEVISGNPAKLNGQTIRKVNDPSTNASVSEIQPFFRFDKRTGENKLYYKMSLFVGYSDVSSVEGNFTITPNTRVLQDVSIGATTIPVDSTIGFGQTGTIVSGINTDIRYTNKSVNQFFGCSGITSAISITSDIRSDDIYYGYEDGDATKKVELRLTGMLSNFVQTSESLKVSEGDIITVQNLGDNIKNPDQNETYKEIFANSWIYNSSTRYEISDISTYALSSTIDRSSLKIGDRVDILERDTNNIASSTTQIAHISNIDVVQNRVVLSNLSFTPDPSLKYDLRRRVNTASSSVVPLVYGNDKILSDLQNLYVDDENYAYVASNSLPSGRSGYTADYSYEITKNVNVSKINNNGIVTDQASDGNFYTLVFPNDVTFITGDRVYYQPENAPLVGLETGSYYIGVQADKKRVNLYSSRSFIGGSDYITFREEVGAGIGTHTFTLYEQRSGKIGPQKVFKKLPLDVNIKNGTAESTLVGSTGMLINGVEINNYKSNDRIYYGPLQSVDVLSGGEEFDVINPPVVAVTGSGTTALIQPVISGSIDKVYVDKQDFDIASVVSIGVSGGNGTGAVLEAIVGKRIRPISFDARTTLNGGGINTSTNQIYFLTDHNLTNGEGVIYNSTGLTAIPIGAGTSSLVTNNTYYAQVDNNRTIRIYPTGSDYLSGINTITFNNNDTTGIHQFKTGSGKKTLSEIKVVDGGEGYVNRKLIVKPSGISTITDTVTFEDHGFKSGDLINYNFETSTISGISSSLQYYVLKNDDDSFRLCDAGIAGTTITNYEQENYVSLNSTGSGYQYFSAPEISVVLKYNSTGIGTTTQAAEQTFVVTPKVSGSIIDAYVYEKGTGYGSTTLNFQKNPLISIKNGREAVFTPVVINGAVTQVNVNYGGMEYYSAPNLTVVDSTGKGTGAELSASISGGKVTSVNVINTGIGYSDVPYTTVRSTSAGRNAVLSVNIRPLTVNSAFKYGNENLIETQDNDLKYSVCGYFDGLQTAFNDDGSSNSNIIGWAYDGNPIYGPYGYLNPKDITSGVVILQSGYQLNTSKIVDRPSGFDDGFFVEDYEYTNCGHLDEYNGRFEITPEFPNGVYAYHAGITTDGLKAPTFPYFIGDKYRSKTLEENSTLTQEYDFNNSSLLRNTFPYKVADEYADSDFTFESNELVIQEVEIEAVSSGNVTGFNIVNSGVDYKINDVLDFNDEGTDGGGLIVKVSSIEGKDISNVTTNTQSYDDVIFTWSDEEQVEGTIFPHHNLLNNDNVVVSGFSTLSSLNNSFKIGVSSETASCIKEISAYTAGLSTEIYVSHIPNTLSVGSSIGIGAERLEVLNIYNTSNILKVQRGSTGVSHTATSTVNYLPNTFSITPYSDYFESKVNDKVYFNPTESVGVGTTPGAMLSMTSDFGDTTITRQVPTQGIYIENHPFKENQAVTYTSAGSFITILDTPTGTPYNLTSPQTVYISNKNKNIIGIKTGAGTSEVYFTSNGSFSDNYSLESSYTQVTGKVQRLKSTVAVTTSHGLENGDIITLDINPNSSVGIGSSASVVVKRDTLSGNILINSIGFNSTGVSTATNSISLNALHLKTGDKVKYSANEAISGLTAEKSYFLYKVNTNKVQFAETYSNSIAKPPIIVGMGDTGGIDQSISLINPQIQSVKNNNLVFDLSDSSLTGYEFKIYYDQDFKNEFVSTGSSTIFNISGAGTVGSGTTSSLTIGYDALLPRSLYYNLEKSGYITTADNGVQNYSEIVYVDSDYNRNYSVSGTTDTTFDVSLDFNPSNVSYAQTDCDTLKYYTKSPTARGPIHKTNIVSSGTGYKKLPTYVGSSSSVSSDANLVSKSTTIGNIKKIRVVNDGFGYPSDPTLQPTAYISNLYTLNNANTIGIVTAVDGGKNYTVAPNIIIVDSNTGEKLDTGILEATLSGNSIGSVEIKQQPKGLPDQTVKLFATDNTNGITIQQVQSSATGIFTCVISTPTLGYVVNPFDAGDKVYVEGIQKVGTAGSGFNSEDYGYKFFSVQTYDTSGTADKVTINLAGISTNTGIAKTVQDASGSIINTDVYPVFDVAQGIASFTIGERIRSNGILRDLTISSQDQSFIKVAGSYELSLNEVISGAVSGTIATIDAIDTNLGKFKIDYSLRKDRGWEDNIGMLDEDNQLIPNNDYYQNLSYTVKSPITWDKLKTPVNSLLHTSGTKNFSDTVITGNSGRIGIGSTSVAIIVRDVLAETRVDTIYQYDEVVDIDTVGSQSKFLKLKTKKLSDYIEANNNVVLKIDDLSQEFSNYDGDPSPYVNITRIDSTESYGNMLLRITNPDNTEIQFTEVALLNDGTNDFFMEKGSLVNVGPELIHLPTEALGLFSIITDEYDRSYLRFTPTDPTISDYDIKVLKTEFNSSVSGIGTTDIGFVNLTSSTGIATAGVTTSIVSAAATNISALYTSAQVIDQSTNEMNLVEIYLTHDGTDINTAEYYFNSDNDYVGNFIGTFSASLSGGSVSLNYLNDTSNSVQVRTRNVGFGTTTGGSGTYRFKTTGQADGAERSVIYQSNYESKTGITTVVEIDGTSFNAVKSLVEVSTGSTNSLHQIMTVFDQTDVYIQQAPFISVGHTAGLGTFGGNYSGGNLILTFYPDSNVTQKVNISSFNQCFYTEIDKVNVPNGLQYGNTYDTVDLKFYDSYEGNRINRTGFNLTSNSIPIFSKTFNPAILQSTGYDNLNKVGLAATTGIFSIKDHFFSDGEELVYKPNSTFVGVGTSALQIPATLNSLGVSTTLLPSDVYVIKINDDSFKLATRPSYASTGLGVTFTGWGEGNDHQLIMDKRVSKSLITINGLVQYPLIRTNISHTLSGNGGSVGIGTSIFALSGISTIAPNDILKVDDEYMGVVNVGYGLVNIGPITNSGTVPLVQVERAFVGSTVDTHADTTGIATIYRGSYDIVDNRIHFTKAPRGNPQLDKTDGNLLHPTDDFTGRVFLRKDYSTNQVYDDISDQFTGIGRTFTLTVGGANTAGIGTTGGNGLVFVNNTFQTPSTPNNPSGNFQIYENTSAGISTVEFAGIQDPGTLQYITSDSDVNQNQIPRGGVIISMASTGGLGYAPLVGANIMPLVDSNGTITSIVGVGTSTGPVAVSTATYNNKTGILNVVTETPHNFRGIVNQTKLSGLHFTCAGNYDVGSATYNETTGDLELGIGPHVLTVGEKVKINNNSLVFTCTGGGGTHSYPRAGTDPIAGISTPITGTGATTITINVGIGTTAIHTFSSASAGAVRYGDNYLGISTTVFPDHDNAFNITGIVSTTSFNVNVGTSTIRHTYVGLGSAWGWHGQLTFGSGYSNNISIGVTVLDTEYEHKFITALSNAINPSVGPDLTPIDAIYTPSTGNLILEFDSPHGKTVSNTIQINNESLIFTCDRNNYISTHTYPRVGKDPASGATLSIDSTTSKTISVGVGSAVGSGAIITATVGVGGSLAFSVGAGGTGYTNPRICVSEPSYSNLEVTGISRLGTGATTDCGNGLLVDLNVAAASSVGIGSTYFEIKSFDIVRNGYGFQRGDIIKPVGLVTDGKLGSPLTEYTLTVLDTYSDNFAAWEFGSFDYIDSIAKYQDGSRTRFPLYYNDELLSFEGLLGTNVALANALLIFINGVIQDPGVSYEFDGGTSFIFKTPPKQSDKVAIFFYLGTRGEDTTLITSVSSSIKKGDVVQVMKNDAIPGTVTQDERTTYDISYSDKFETNLYTGLGINTNTYKPLSWMKQKADKVINGENVYKSRDSLEALIYPTARIIGGFSMSTTSTNQLFVDDAEFFDYDTPANFDGLVVNGMSTTASGSVELIKTISLVNGNSGNITGIGTTTGTGSNPLALKFTVDSLAGLSTGYPVYVFNTEVGSGVTSIDNSNSQVVGVGTTCVDNVYYVNGLDYSDGALICNINSLTSTSGLSTTGSVTSPVGQFSWGRLSGFTRSSSPISIAVTGYTVDSGLSTFPSIQRRGTGFNDSGALPKKL